MKHRFLFLLLCIGALTLAFGQKSGGETVSSQEKAKKDTLINIDYISGTKDTTLTDHKNDDIYYSFDAILEKTSGEAKKPKGIYTSKEVFIVHQAGKEHEQWYYLQKQPVHKTLHRVYNNILECNRVMYFDLNGDAWKNDLWLSVLDVEVDDGSAYTICKAKNDSLMIWNYYVDCKQADHTYKSSDCDIEKLFNSKVDSLRKAYPQVDFDALMRED